MATKLLYPLRDFSLGHNDKDDPSLLNDRALSDTSNVVVGRGFISTRPGTSRYTPIGLPNAVQRLYTFRKNNGSSELLAVSNQTLYKDTAGTLNAIPFNGISSLSGNEASFLTYKDRSINDVVLIADGGKLKVYNGTDVREVTPRVPTAEESPIGVNDLGTNFNQFRSIAIKQDRIFALANGSVKNRLCFCHRDPNLGYAVYDYWPAKYFYDLVSEQNDEALTLRTFRNAIIVFCSRTIWALTGDGITQEAYELRRINVPSGLFAPDSVAYVGNYIFYLSDDDRIYRLVSTDQEYISAEVVSTDPNTGSSIENTLKSIPYALKKNARAYSYENKYFISFPNGITLVYDTDLRCWVKWTGIAANSFLEQDGVLYFSINSGLIMKFDSNIDTDDNVKVPWGFKLKRLDFNYPIQDKKLRKMWIVAKQYEEESSTINVKAIIDDVTVDITDISTDESLVWDEGNWDESSWDFKDVVVKELKLRERGKTVQYVFSGEGFVTLYQAVTQFKVKKP